MAGGGTFDLRGNRFALCDPKIMNVRPIRRRICFKAKNLACRDFLKCLHGLEMRTRAQVCQHLVARFPDA